MALVGGNAVIAPHGHKFMGIRNGIDPELWSPEDNQFLPMCYSAENVVEGKKAARQMIAMRYGSVPVVRHTGGLRDTVFDVDFDKERAAWELYGSSDWQRDGIDATNGFAFTGTDGGALDYALNRAIDAWYNDRAWFHSLQRRVMEQDWSWNRPAIDYIELYFSALKS
ncbi:hypothetical protein GPECTOR_61g864 [Gonium pectorale]|uniref:starch synthase n=1 Tax=Gonium pectorale TaxID=33097 RepID=A0A150G512_GONPE|nr:hypothetical protein GPECTOR_61g864 [Gonium pectorale]|eukprot:KXZ44911.1 hypothetical protein GPECTOR_61g864 [Gonium pectorale]